MLCNKSIVNLIILLTKKNRIGDAKDKINYIVLAKKKRNYMKISMLILLCITPFSLYLPCFGEIDQMAITAKENSEKAMTDARSAELTKTAKYDTKKEKETAKRQKAMSAIGAADLAITTAETIMQDEKQSTDSKNLAEKAIKEAEEAIKKAGAVLAAS